MKQTIILLVLSLKIISQNNNLINGVFIVDQVKYYDSLTCNFNQLKTANNVAAYFTYSPLINITPSNYCKAGNVKFNNDPLDYDHVKKFYSETEVNSINQQNWKVSGHDVIPNMNFIFNGIQPNFDISTSLLKDTLNKSDTLFLFINNIQNADSIRISISDDTQQPNQHHIALQAPNYSNVYYLPPALFTPLIIGPRASITVEAIKYNYQTVAGLRYLFMNSFSFVRTNVKIIN